MKKYFFLFLLLTSTSGQLVAQSYTPLLREGMEWYISYHHTVDCFPFGCCGISRCYIDGDTVFKGKRYAVINYQNLLKQDRTDYPCSPPFIFSSPANGNYSFLREDTVSGRVYRLDDPWSANSQENLIFDFKAQTGDTLYDRWGFGTVIDTVTFVTLKNGSTSKVFSTDSGWYMEGIGGVRGPNYPPGASISASYRYECVKENGVDIWGNECFKVVSVDEETAFTKNPIRFDLATREVSIDLSPDANASYELISVTGKSILKGHFSNATRFSLPPIPAGIYILTLRNNQGVFAEKIMIR